MSKTRRLRPDQNFTKGQFVARRVLQPGILGRCAWATLHLLLGATTTVVGRAATAVAPSRRVARAKFWIQNSYSVHRVSMRKTQCALSKRPLHVTAALRSYNVSPAGKIMILCFENLSISWRQHRQEGSSGRLTELKKEPLSWIHFPFKAVRIPHP